MSKLKIQAVVCPSCGCITEIRKMKRCLKQQVVGRNVCYTCKEAYKASMVARNKSASMRKRNSLRMKADNPMSKPEVRVKVASTLTKQQKDIKNYLIPKRLIRRETRAEMSARMKISNPMFNHETRLKVSNTWKERMESGEIAFKRGKDHWLWKGNKDFNNSCRSNIYSCWTRPVMERDGFLCQECGTHDDLQVHHVKPLRTIIKEVKDLHCIKTFLDVPSSEWQPYINEVIEKHKLEYGVTVCKSCHRKIDDQFRGC